MNSKLLLITDRDDLAKLQAQMLMHSGLDVTILNHTLTQNKKGAAAVEGYDLILVNMFDEDSDSLEICRNLRGSFYNPILVLIYERDERSLLRAYDAGADDCLVQPLSIHLLVAKIQAWLRRSGLSEKSINYIEAYNFRFDPVKSEVITPQEELIRLSQLEARLLHLLMSNRGQIVETNQILQRVWPDNVESVGDRHLLKALVHRLRRKLEADPTDPRYIHTIPHQGYSFHLN
jgi:DNA-binding response OmpR family regulator